MNNNSDIEPVYLDASDTIFPISDFALDYGLENVKDAGGPLIPFLVIQTNGEFSLERFLSDTLTESIEHAREKIQTLPSETDAYALAYDGYVTVDNQKYDAILVEVGERGNEKGYKFAQRYQPKKVFRAFSLIGNQIFLGKTICSLK